MYCSFKFSPTKLHHEKHPVFAETELNSSLCKTRGRHFLYRDCDRMNIKVGKSRKTPTTDACVTKVSWRFRASWSTWNGLRTSGTPFTFFGYCWVLQLSHLFLYGLLTHPCADKIVRGSSFETFFVAVAKFLRFHKRKMRFSVSLSLLQPTNPYKCYIESYCSFIIQYRLCQQKMNSFPTSYRTHFWNF